MDYKLIYIPNDNIQSLPLCKLQFVVKTLKLKKNNQNSLLSPKLLLKRIRKRYNKTLGTSDLEVKNEIKHILLIGTFFLD